MRLSRNIIERMYKHENNFFVAGKEKKKVKIEAFLQFQRRTQTLKQNTLMQINSTILALIPPMCMT